MQYRNRDGQVGLDVIQRCVDGIFFNNVKLVASLQADNKNFANNINQEELNLIKEKLKTVDH